jgi:hypothetical protein
MVVGGALIVPRGFLSFLRSEVHEDADAADRDLVERLALEAVIAAEQALGHDPRDVRREKLGYDIESRVPHTGRLRFLEVKEHRAGQAAAVVGVELLDHLVLGATGLWVSLKRQGEC